MRRLFDAVAGSIMLIILSPVLMIVAIAIKFDSKGPVFFTQMRIGRDNRLFKFYKFRTMKIGAPNVAKDKLSDADNYITNLGRFLRKTSIDELPQLINIIRGEMTFVGPRPALFSQYELKALRTKTGVHKLIPGVTGWAQINGRDTLNDVEKSKYDEYYLKHRTIRFNLYILFKTIFKVIKRDGIVEGGISKMNG